MHWVPLEMVLEGWAFGIVVKTLLGIPTSCIEVLGSSLAFFASSPVWVAEDGLHTGSLLPMWETFVDLQAPGCCGYPGSVLEDGN